MAGLRKCSSCKEYLLPDAFTPKAHRCKPCAAAVSSKWRKENPERAVALQKAWRTRDGSAQKKEGYRIKYRYGLSMEDREKMRETQNDSCAICRSKFVKAPHIDHCHKTGLVRGLLCDLCNRGIGYFQDDPERLSAASMYIKGAS